MSGLERRLERDLARIADAAPTTGDAWSAVADRIAAELDTSNRDVESSHDTDPEILMLDPRPIRPARSRTRWLAAAAAAVVLAVVIGLIVGLRGDDRNVIVDVPATTTPGPQPEPDPEPEPAPEPAPDGDAEPTETVDPEPGAEADEAGSAVDPDGSDAPTDDDPDAGGDGAPDPDAEPATEIAAAPLGEQGADLAPGRYATMLLGGTLTFDIVENYRLDLAVPGRLRLVALADDGVETPRRLSFARIVAWNDAAQAVDPNFSGPELNDESGDAAAIDTSIEALFADGRISSSDAEVAEAIEISGRDAEVATVELDAAAETVAAPECVAADGCVWLTSAPSAEMLGVGDELAAPDAAGRAADLQLGVGEVSRLWVIPIDGEGGTLVVQASTSPDDVDWLSTVFGETVATHTLALAVPSQWPETIPLPEGLSIVTTSVTTVLDSDTVAIFGTLPSGAFVPEAFLEELAAADFDIRADASTNEVTQVTLQRRSRALNFLARTEPDGTWRITMSTFLTGG